MTISKLIIPADPIGRNQRTILIFITSRRKDST